MKLTQVDFQERRDRLAAQMGPNSIAIIATSPVAMRNRDADYKYRTDRSFFYLTGFAEPEAVCFPISPGQGRNPAPGRICAACRRNGRRRCRRPRATGAA